MAREELITTMGTALKKLRAIRPHLDRIAGASAEQLIEATILHLRTQPRLMECTVSSFLRGVMMCGRLRLTPDVRGQAYFVPRRTGALVNGQKQWECQFQIGYQGMLELAYRSGKVASVEAHEVYDGDEFDFAYGTDSFLKHVPKLKAHAPDKIVAAYCISELFNARRMQFWVVSRDEIDAIPESRIPASVGPNDAAYYSPWRTSRAAMWRKTAAKRLCKWLPSSVELLTAVSLDDQTEAGVRQTLPPVEAVEGPLSDGDAATLEAYAAVDATNEEGVTDGEQ